jgi:hypothetical protein
MVRTSGGEGGYWPARAHHVNLGGLDLGTVETGVAVMRINQPEPEYGVLGLRALKRFRVTLDFPNGKVEVR